MPNFNALLDRLYAKQHIGHITNHHAEIETNLNLIVAFQCISFPLKNMQLAMAILMIASPFMMPIHKQSSAKLNNFFYPNNLVIT